MLLCLRHSAPSSSSALTARRRVKKMSGVSCCLTVTGLVWIARDDGWLVLQSSTAVPDESRAACDVRARVNNLKENIRALQLFAHKALPLRKRRACLLQSEEQDSAAARL